MHTECGGGSTVFGLFKQGLMVRFLEQGSVDDGTTAALVSLNPKNLTSSFAPECPNVFYGLDI